jgi:hypothetical protein
MAHALTAHTLSANYSMHLAKLWADIDVQNAWEATSMLIEEQWGIPRQLYEMDFVGRVELLRLPPSRSASSESMRLYWLDKAVLDSPPHIYEFVDPAKFKSDVAPYGNIARLKEHIQHWQPSTPTSAQNKSVLIAQIENLQSAGSQRQWLVEPLLLILCGLLVVLMVTRFGRSHLGRRRLRSQCD